LDQDAAARLADELAVVPPLLAQARENLVGEARELWEAGIGNLRRQAADLAALEAQTADAGVELAAAVAAARRATTDFVAWLEEQAPLKTGPSGIGNDDYTWHLRNVQLVPMTWEDEVELLRRELARAHAALRLEEHRNRHLPPLVAISSPAEYERRTHAAVDAYLAFLADREILRVEDYMDPALRARRGEFVPLATRNFFATAIHYEPMTLWTHFYHWFDLARMQARPDSSPIRRGPLLYNVWASRAEGLATGMEEMMMHAGLYDDNPRVREIVWIMLAQRAARGLGSLYAHANQMTMAEAGRVHMDWTPRGWMKTEEELLIFEQHLYLRQPGYGTSYVTGKYLLERTLADYARQLEARGEELRLRDFFDRLNAIDSIPISLGRWELTGLDDEMRQLDEARRAGS
jgi:hypothetical protein